MVRRLKRELEPLLAGVFKVFDQDGNGVMDLKETQAVMEFMNQGSGGHEL